MHISPLHAWRGFCRLSLLSLAILLLPLVAAKAQPPAQPQPPRPSEEQWSRQREEMKRMMIEMEKFQDQMMEQMMENKHRMEQWRTRLNEAEARPPALPPRPEGDQRSPGDYWRDRRDRPRRTRCSAAGSTNTGKRSFSQSARGY